MRLGAKPLLEWIFVVAAQSESQGTCTHKMRSLPSAPNTLSRSLSEVGTVVLVNPSTVEEVGERPYFCGVRRGLMLEKVFNLVSSLFSSPGSTDGMHSSVQDLGVTQWEAAA